MLKNNSELICIRFVTHVKSPIIPIHINKLSHPISNCSQQADHLTINLIENVGAIELKRLTKGKFKNHKNLIRIEFR